MTGRDPDLESGWDPDGLADARLDEAASTRRRRRDHAEFGAMETTIGSVLAGAAATAELVTIETVDGGRHRGRVAGIGADVVVMMRDDGRRVALRLTSLSVMRRGPGGAVDERPSAPGSTTLHEVVASYAGSRTVVTMVCAGGTTVVGEVAWCGEDVAGVRTLDDPSGEVIVYLASLSEVSSPTSS